MQKGTHERIVVSDWNGSAWQDESTFHQLSPYLGKTKSSIAASLIEQFTQPNDTVMDPFSGCGTIAFEAWSAGRNVVANDLSPYALVLTRAKLFPYPSVAAARRDLRELAKKATARTKHIDLRCVPEWVRDFFNADTLREAIAWSDILRSERRWFLLSCLLGILHHQRPGFLSYPSSHTVPYLRVNKFPRNEYPELYEYRSTLERLDAKVTRAFRRVPELDRRLRRTTSSKSADRLTPPRPIDAIITSPPYMHQLDYGRDNRLRLWFLRCKDWHALDGAVSPRQTNFLRLMERCFQRWRAILKPKSPCILIVGNESKRTFSADLPGQVAALALKKVGGFSLVMKHTDTIPNERRVRRGITGTTAETVLVLRRTRSN